MSASQDQDPNPRDDVPRRRPYAAPEIVESATFETLALACGKTSGNDICDFSTGTSGS